MPRDATLGDGSVDAMAMGDASADGGTPSDAAVDEPFPDEIESALLLNAGQPMACADPTVVSVRNEGEDFYVFCTGMLRIWHTTDWVTFEDVRPSTTFSLTGVGAQAQAINWWWAPSVTYDGASDSYVMWVSIPSEASTGTAGGTNARSLGVFTAEELTGPWSYEGDAITGAAMQMYIDPFLFRDHDGKHYVFWKHYGPGIGSLIAAAEVSADWHAITGSQVTIMNGYGGTGTWEDNVRENPALYYDPAADRHHLIFSGGHWNDQSYATGHALSACGPLCVDADSGGWRMVESGDRGILQVVRTADLDVFGAGGAGGAEFLGARASYLLYAAAAPFGSNPPTRYLMLDPLSWANGAPFVDTDGHHPTGY
ncbi:MAG: family 43 glycosylhydrolase [Sandaracinaceae bacterium]|nr:family 43 glycosylhydrolase [Sandaracinaceae bacterium]